MTEDKIHYTEVTKDHKLEAKEGSWYADNKLVYWLGSEASEAHAKLGQLFQKQRRDKNAKI